MPLPNAEYTLEFDPATVMRLKNFIAAAPVFLRYYEVAMRACVNQVKTRAVMNAPVQFGTLRRAIVGRVETPLVGRVGVLSAVPYARRREFGFDNRTDSLGRFYPLDPKDPAKRAKMFYLKRALEESIPFIQTTFKTSAQLAIRTMSAV